MSHTNDMPWHMKCIREGNLTKGLYDCSIYEITDAFVRFWESWYLAATVQHDVLYWWCVKVLNRMWPDRRWSNYLRCSCENACRHNVEVCQRNKSGSLYVCMYVGTDYVWVLWRCVSVTCVVFCQRQSLAGRRIWYVTYASRYRIKLLLIRTVLVS